MGNVLQSSSALLQQLNSQQEIVSLNMKLLEKQQQIEKTRENNQSSTPKFWECYVITCAVDNLRLLIQYIPHESLLKLVKILRYLFTSCSWLSVSIAEFVGNFCEVSSIDEQYEVSIIQ